MADLYNPLAGVRGTGRTYNDLLASRPGTRDAFAQQLMQMLSGVKLNAPGAPAPVDPGVDPSMDPLAQPSYQADIFDQLFGAGNYLVNQNLFNQPGYSFVSGQLRDPYQANNHVGRWVGQIDANGNLSGLRWKNDSTTTSLVDRIGNFATDWGPALVLAAATAGAGGFAGLAGGAGEAAGAGAAGTAPAAAVAPGTASAGTLGSGTFGTGALGGDIAAGTYGLGAADAATIPFGSLTGVAIPQGQMSLIPGMIGGAGEGLAYGAAGAAAADAVGAAGAADGAAPISASTPTTVASPFKMALDAVKPYASLIGPATSLLGAATAQTPQMPQNADARIPGVEAPPEARGLDRQAARSPILDVLGRNRRENRNRTLLTGPGGVNMESVRVGANTLLGM